MKLKKLSWIAAALALVVPFKAASAETATLVGSDTCIACHSEQAASFSSSMHGKMIPVVKGIALDKACETCHGAGSLHAAAAGDKTNAGFSTIKNPAKTDTQGTEKICFTCHKDKALMLWGTSTHSQNGLTCAKCHSVHNGQGPKNLKKDVNETCYQCHPKQKADSKLASHHPIQEGKMFCVSCHNPHGGIDGNLKADSKEELCAKCHAEKVGPFANEHPPVAEGCDICHRVHGSANDKLLRQPAPTLCQGCHRKAHGSMNVGSYKTAAANNQATFQQRVRCIDCHREIHGSDRQQYFAQ